MLLIKRKVSLILVKDPTDRLEDTEVSAKAGYSINITEEKSGNLSGSTLRWKQKIFVG